MALWLGRGPTVKIQSREWKLTALEQLVAIPQIKYILLPVDIIPMCDVYTHDSKIEQATRLLLESLGIDLSDENFKETPGRMARAYADLCKYVKPSNNVRVELENCLSKMFPTKYKGMIIQEPIRAYSLCSHHLLPVTYDVLFGYIPRKLSLGFSKSVKAINLLAARPISQEDLTHEIIETFEKLMRPKGVMIVVRGLHTCMQIRSVRTEAVNITSALRGDFKDSESSRNEFLALAKFKGCL